MTAIQIYAPRIEKSPIVVNRSLSRGNSVSSGRNGIADNVTPNHPWTSAAARTLPLALLTTQVRIIVNGKIHKMNQKRGTL
ncbi:MAG: hypothetical protein HeimC2_36840 [Candidatus Heimdallarchaeota archaeon LC_2]|nr:MAG: hypothetical protein HeimC2_36840 [Candidatus Heimdallarchaeota archaeon LC_2]